MKKHDYTKDLYKADSNGYGCAHCGRVIKRGDLMLECADCAAIFCESCVNDGAFESHQCDDYDWEDD